MPYARTTTGAHVATELVALYRHQLEACRLAKGECCLIITDTAYDDTASAACLGAVLALDANPIIVTLPYGVPFPGATLASTMAEADLIIGVTTHRLHYDPHLRAALDGGTRALLAVQPTHVLHRLAADSEVVARTRTAAQRLAKANTLTIASERGTDLSMTVSNRPALAHCGVADEPGHFDFWGASMVEIAPLEGTVEGTLVLGRGDQIFHLGRYIDEDVTIRFERGRAVAIEGGLDAFLLKTHLEGYRDPNAFLAGHVAWGTDHRASWTAPLVQFPEAGAGNADTEGFLGSVQVELGSNDDQYFRGTISSAAHIGLCSLEASVALDGELVIEAGRFVGSLSACQPEDVAT
jgi:2,5-dihydroxypyridine 5,6-dioxygenase